MIATMRERMEAKVTKGRVNSCLEGGNPKVFTSHFVQPPHFQMGNNNNNGFKFRKLFQMFDKTKTGQVHYEDFRNMCETFGMQLDDDSLLALFCVYDPEGTGYLSYHDLAKQLMDPDCYAL